MIEVKNDIEQIKKDRIKCQINVSTQLVDIKNRIIGVLDILETQTKNQKSHSDKLIEYDKKIENFNNNMLGDIYTHIGSFMRYNKIYIFVFILMFFSIIFNFVYTGIKISNIEQIINSNKKDNIENKKNIIEMVNKIKNKIKENGE